MFDFNLADKEIIASSNFILDCNNLLSIIISLKKFQFAKEEIDFDLSELIKEDVIKIVGDKILINQNNMFFYIAHKGFMSRFNFSFSQNIASLFEHLENVDDYFDKKEFAGKHEFLVGIDGMALMYFIQNYQFDLSDFYRTWKREPKNNLFRFSDAFCKILPEIFLDNDLLLSCLKELYSAHEYDKKDVFNVNVGELDNAIKRYASANTSSSKAVLESLLINFDELNERLAVNFLAGIIEVDKSYLDQVKQLSRNPLFQPFIICSLRFNIKYTTLELHKVLSLLNEIDNSTEKYLLQLPRLYLNFLYDDEMDEFGKEVCFERLKILITIDNKNIVGIVLNDLRFFRKNENLTHALLVSMIEASSFDENLMSLTSNIFHYYEDCHHFFEFIGLYAVKFKFHFKAETYSYELYHLRNKNQKKFDSQLVKFLINDLGEIRIVGTRIFSELSSHYNVKYFELNILELKPIEQFKLFTSIFSLYLEHSHSLPYLIPLFESPNEFVREAFISRVEILSEDYGSTVLNVLKDIWHSMSEEQVKIYQRLFDYAKNFGDELNRKMGIKELDPYYTQYKFLSEYNQTHQKLLQKSVNENVDKGSIIRQLANTVILAKGGGWRCKEKEEVSQLSKIGTSMIIPRSYMISPDNYEWEKMIEQSENWNNFLKEWEAIL